MAEEARRRRAGSCPNWPKEYGGTGWSSTQKFIFEMEMARANSPYLSSFSLKMVAPVLMKYGSEAQKKRFLPKIAAAEELWCQGYSEPGSGSDLASLRTRAERQGDHYIVNGQKIWTTNAHWADWMFCLVRTSNEGKRQEGISFLLIDMKTPGIRVDPIYLVDGTRTPMRHEVNQVFFTDVKVPVENRVGEENKGWTYAKYLLEFERGGQAHGPRLRKAFRHLQTLSKTQLDEGEPLSASPHWREKMAALEMELDAVEMNELMFYSSLKTGDAPGSMALDRQDARHRGRPEDHRARRRGGRLVRHAVHRAAQLRQQRRAGRRRATSTTWRRATSTSARPRSTAARPRCRGTCSRRRCWGFSSGHL